MPIKGTGKGTGKDIGDNGEVEVSNIFIEGLTENPNSMKPNPKTEVLSKPASALTKKELKEWASNIPKF